MFKKLTHSLIEKMYIELGLVTKLNRIDFKLKEYCYTRFLFGFTFLVFIQCGFIHQAYANVMSPSQEAIQEPNQQISQETSQDSINVQNVPLNAVSPELLKDFVTVIDLIRREYYYPVSDDYIFKDAMIGMLKGIAPYAEFLDTKAYENLKAFSDGDLAQVGIGVAFDQTQNTWIVKDVEVGSPAVNAGIKPKNYLHQINQTPLTSKFNSHDINQMLRGIAGSQVDLIISNEGRQKRTVTLQRSIIEENKVKVVFDSGLVSIKIPVFHNDTQTIISKHLAGITQPINGVLIDVRDNPGGVLDSAVDVVGLIQESGGVAIIKDRAGNQQLIEVFSENTVLNNIPVVVLQNRYSASASEVLASSLQVNNLATIVGEVSYGKGSIQEVLPINETEAIKLTVAHYLQADGAIIDGVGVKPDIMLKQQSYDSNWKLNKDEWLDQATTIIRNLMPRDEVNAEMVYQ